MTRRAARTAALVAVPVALLAGFVAFRVLAPSGSATGAGASPAPAATTPVEVPAPALGARPALVCRALLARLPDRLGGLARRPVTAGPEQNAAYGDPALVVACGVPGPTPPDGAQFLRINGLCWYAEDGADTATWSLQEREVPLVVRVPKAQNAQDLVDLARPVGETVAQTTRVCP